MGRARKITAALTVLLLASVLLSVCAAAYEEDEPVGSLERALTCHGEPSCVQFECELGKAAADAVLLETGADAAVLPGGIFVKELRGLGTVTAGDILQVFDEDHEIRLAAVSPAELRAFLETGLSHLAVGADEFVDYPGSEFEGFPQISGLKVVCDVSAPPGERIRSMELRDGTALTPEDDGTVLTLAVTAELADGAFGYPALQSDSAGKTLSECFINGFSRIALGELSLHRIVLIGSNEYTIVHTLSRPVVLIAVALLAVPIVYAKRKLRRAKRA